MTSPFKSVAQRMRSWFTARKPRTLRKHPNGFRPLVETLEDRLAPASVAYVTGPPDPWFNTTNDAALNAAFGAGNWDKYSYAAAPAAIFTPGAYEFVFVDGGDSNGSAFAAFVTTYQSSLQNFVSSGNSLLLNAAQNNGPGTINTGFGATLIYPQFSPNAYAVNPADPIFNGPFTPTGTSWSGNYFGHDGVSVGAGYNPLITSGPSGSGFNILVDASYGGGTIFVGGMTTANFHGPQPDSTNLLQNILAYAATNPLGGLGITSTSPANGSVVSMTPTQYIVNVTDPVNAGTIDATDFQVNGIPADAYAYIPGSTSIYFTFGTDPVTAQGLQTMHIDQNAFTRVSDGKGVKLFDGSFYYDVLLMQVTSTAPADGSVVLLPFATLDLNFNEAYDFASADPSDFILSQGSVASVSQVDADTLQLTLSGVISEGTLSVNMPAGAMIDSFGNPGAAYTGSFTLDFGTLPYPVPLTSKPPLGSLIYDPSITAVIAPAGDTDSFTIAVDAGQTITVLVTPDAGLQPTIDLYDPSNAPIGTSTAAASGTDAVLQTIAVATAGTYTITVGGAAGTTGQCTVQVILNAALENESHDGASNNTLLTAQDINGSFIDLTTGSAERGAVLGSVSAPLQLFGSDQNGRYLSVNRVTGAATVITNGVNGGRGYTDLARNPVTGVLYGSGAQGDNGFYVVDPVTGAGTLIGFSGNQLHSLAWSPNGTTLYAVRNFNEFGTVDAGTGAFTFISFAPSRVHGMAFHPVTGVLYAVPQTGELDTVDTSTGAFTVVGNTGIQLLSLEFMPDGALLASGNGSLYSINPATGAATFIGSTSVGTLIGLEGIPSADNIDLYSFTMASGQTTTLALKGYGGILELLDGFGVPVASGVSAANLDQVINNFTAAAGTYYARVTSTSNTDYSLVVTRDASFDTENNNTLATAQNIDATNVALGYVSSIGQLLGADDGDLHLLSIDPATGAATILASNIGGGRGYNDLALNPVTDVLYGSQALATSGLYSIDTVTFAETFIGNLGGNVRALAWSPDGMTLYGFRDSTFGTINPTNAAFMPINDPGIGFVGGIAFQPVTGTLFAVTNVRGVQGLYTLTLTGIPTLVGNPGNDYNSLEFLADGTLLAGVGRGGANPGFLVQLDPATAAPTMIGPIVPSGNRNVTGLEALPATDDFYSFTVTAGNSIKLSTTTPAGGPGEFVNDLDPKLELFDPNGVSVASDDNSGPDGRNAKLTHTALLSGVYTVRVTGAGFSKGEYVLQLNPNQPPTAVAGGAYVVDEGTPITLDGSGSTDDNGIVTYEWDLDYDGVTFDVDLTTASPTISHTFAEEGSATIALRVTDADGASSIATASLTVNDPPVVAQASGPFELVEGSAVLTDAIVATFTDPGGAEDFSNYSADINWGDDTHSAGTIVPVAAVNVHIYSGFDHNSGGGAPYSGLVGSFTANDVQFATDTGFDWHPFGQGDFGADITGSLNVASTGTYSFSLDSDDGSLLYIDGNLVINNGNPHSPNTMSGSATLAAGVHSFEVQFMEVLGGESGVDLSLPAGVSYANTNGQFVVTGSHTYVGDTINGESEGDANITVTISHEDTTPQVVTDTATIVDTPVVASGNLLFTVQEGSAALSSVTVATFTDPGDPAGNLEDANDYSATIYWGDGNTDAGIIQNNGDGTFSVIGSHTYFGDTLDNGESEGTVTLVVTISHEATEPQVVNDTVTITDPNIVAGAGFTYTVQEGSATLTNVAVATFTDPGNPTGTAEDMGDYEATIDWGDGQTSVGTITHTGGGVFTVTGSHTYSGDTINGESEGDATITTTIIHATGLIGPTLVAPYQFGGDYATEVLVTYTAYAFSSQGTVDSFQSFNEDVGGWAPGQTFTVLQLRPTGGSTYQVINAQTFTTSSTLGLATYDLSSTWTVQAGDIYASYGQGIPINIDNFPDGNSADPLYFPNDHLPVVNENITLGSDDFQAYPQFRDYYLDANFSLTATVTSSVTITDPPVVATGGYGYTVAENATTLSNVLVAKFTDPGDPHGNLEDAADYSAMIDWQDGSAPSAATIVNNGDGTFSVYGSHVYLDDGSSPGNGTASDTYAIDVAISHETAGVVHASSSVKVTNVAPTITSLSLSSTSINEGSSTTLTIKWNDPGTLDTYTVTINWGDDSDPTILTITPSVDVIGVGASATGSSTLMISHVYADDGPSPGNGTPFDVSTIHVTVADDDLGSDSGSINVTVKNVAPTLSAITGTPLTDSDDCHTTWVVSGQFSDPGTDTYKFTINWGDSTSDSFNVPGPGFPGSVGLVAINFAGSASHTYTAFGTYTITVTVMDDDGGSTTATVGSVTVAATAAIVTDPVWGKTLDIHGTDLADHITVNQNMQGGVLVYKVHADSWATDRTFAAAGVNIIRIHLCDGDDEATISSGVNIGSIIFGEGGNDHLNAGNVASIVLGGAGDDMLIGGNDKDILIGGEGADRLVGSSDDDILVAGRTSYDTNDGALKALMAVWNTSGSYASRVAAIQSATATYHLITDGAAQTVFSDHSVDQLTGSAGSDLFFADTTLDETGAVKDVITDLKSETALDIDLT